MIKKKATKILSNFQTWVIIILRTKHVYSENSGNSHLRKDD